MDQPTLHLIAILATNFGLMLTFFGIFVALHNGIRDDVRAVHYEVKDFHHKLYRIEKDKLPKS